MIERHLLNLRARHMVSAEEEEAIRQSFDQPATIKADKLFISARQELNVSTLLLDGIACRFKDLRNGQRQISALHIPGDFIDLHSFTLKRLDHSVLALTPCRFVTMPHDSLRRITEQYPHLARLYWFSTNLDAAMHREWAVSLGRRTAESRVAHLFCELFVRFEIVGMTEGLSYPLPLTQLDIAECMGLTPVHVNRTLKQLRETNLVTFRSGQVTIYDWDRLRAVAEFDPSYLYLERRER